MYLQCNNHFTNQEIELSKDELWDLFKVSYKHYQTEVINDRKIYNRYVNDLISYHLPVFTSDEEAIRKHFQNLIVGVPIDTDIQRCTNHLENLFSKLGIHISKQSYNQLELFVNSFPGNCYSTNPEYDRFLTLSDAATCLMYKERIQHSEETPLKIYYTDRQGVPVAIDISGKEGKNKITDNSNFFCLGPSGSGKSFHMEFRRAKRRQTAAKIGVIIP